MIDPFFLEIFKNPLSAPSLVLVHYILFFIIILKIIFEAVKSYKQNNLFIVTISLFILIASFFLNFYKITEFPPSGHEDDAKVAIAAYIIKKTGHDSDGRSVPYCPDVRVFYHNKDFCGEGQRGITVYTQAFVQYFSEPGYYSLRLQNALVIFFTTIAIIAISFLLTQSLAASLLIGALFIILPWTRTFARMTSESTCICFATTCYLLSSLYLTKKRGFMEILLYLTSLCTMFFAYPTGFLFAPICSILIPLTFYFHSKDHKNLCTKLIILGAISLCFFFFSFRNDEGFRFSLARAQDAQQLAGIASLNLNEFTSSFIKKATSYAANYIAYFLPHYLFLAGDGNLRHNTRFGGELFGMLFISFYIGLIYLIENFKSDIKLKLLLVYLLISPLPASLCVEGALDLMLGLPLHALRSALMLPAVTILVLFGFLQILKKSRTIFFIYLIPLVFNIQLFYSDYFNEYPKRLTHIWTSDPGFPSVTKKAIEILKKHPNKRLFYHSSNYFIPYYNLDRIGIKDLSTGGGVLSNIYKYDDSGDIHPGKGDLFIAEEPFNYNKLNKKVKFILRVKNPYLENNAYGVSLFKIIE
ncbi:MAG: hypothetical protein HY094_08360 [Candidatus Melainabacteria bacterium]|nr:hypothetical protein [Candidatus Melainabacteria bacterium]